jgi:hypothetical protein
MDWDLAIKRNSEALKGIIAALFAMLGLDGEATVERISQPVHRAVLRVLRPAESAVRRLVVIAARGLVVEPAASRPKPAGPIKTKKGLHPRASAFKLFDPRKNFAPRRRRAFAKVPPRIHFFPYDSLRPAAPPAASPELPPDGIVNAERITRRLQALKLALDDLPRQARRLVRLRARREKVPSLKLKSPLRPGPPPGHRKRKIHPIDEILAECHWLAWDALKPDTS